MNKSLNVKQLESNLLTITKRLNEMEARLELWFKVEELEQEAKRLLKLNKGKENE